MKDNKLQCPPAPIKLIGLDLDGTVFDNQKRISLRTKKAIEDAIKQGVVVVPATGRPVAGVPEEFARIEGVQYALTANGAAIYNVQTKKCVYQNAISPELACEVIASLQRYDVMVDAFVDGLGYVEADVLARMNEFAMSEVIKKYILDTRKTVENLSEYIKANACKVEKITVNFKRLKETDEQVQCNAADKKEKKVETDLKWLLHKEEILSELSEYPQLIGVSGVPTNLEITMATADKGNGMVKLGEYLGISPEEIMTCGDSENDMAMILAAGFGVAMANGTDEVKEAANYITDSNEEDGVAKVIEKFVLIQS